MENLLRGLFDRQSFAPDARLQAVIDDVQERYFPKELSMNELGKIYAAGKPEIDRREDNGKKWR